MFNIVKMDLFRLFKSKSVYVVLAVMSALIIMSICFVKMDSQTDNTDEKVQTEEMEADVIEKELSDGNTNIGINVISYTDENDKISIVNDLYSNVSSKAIALFIAIVTVIYTCADLNSGYIKNIAGQVRKRSDLILSKTINLFIFTVLTVVTFIIVETVSSQLILGYINLGKTKEFFVYTGASILLNYAFSIIVMCISLLIRSNLVSMIISISMSMNLTTIIYMLLDKIIAKAGIKNFSIIDYTVTGKLSFLFPWSENREFVSASIVALVFIFIGITLSIYSFKKRDIV